MNVKKQYLAQVMVARSPNVVSFIRAFVRSLVRSIRSFAHSFFLSFVNSFVLSFVRSLVLAFDSVSLCHPLYFYVMQYFHSMYPTVQAPRV